MNNEYLDKILITIRDKYNGRVETNLLKNEHPFINEGNWPSAYPFLLQRGYLQVDYNSAYYTILTPEGERFLVEGGFTASGEYMEETLQVAKDSRKYAKLAFWISVVGIILTVVLFIIDRKK